MSQLPNSGDPSYINDIIEDSEFLSPLDDHSWTSLYQEILQSALLIPAQTNINGDEIIKNSASDNVHVEQVQELSTVPQGAGILLDNGLKLMKISTTPNNPKNVTSKKKCSKIIKENAAMEMELQCSEEGPSNPKKLDHNAKERIRRMKLNSSYLALRALLPDSRRSKKRWSAPAIIDKVLKHIPEMENEVEALRFKKENIVQLSAAKNKKIAVNNEDQNCTISFNKVNQEEAIIQICMARKDGLLAFSNVLQCVEDEGIYMIKSASTLYVCETRICYNLHIQINSTTPGADCIEELREKVTSWLR
ncbi:hypothetical protein DH2020_011207 [Rehmannia glutinosa]|uniref:BHLH domain-containing protein n=1 Tax=Rehmannia glutinosa TaxID=99300 RepID=A0ABR0XCT6_REHGL